jgi:NADH-ubiquinone oxidoreductase chain 5
MYLLLVFLSFLGSCLAGLFGRYLGSHGAAFMTTSCLFFSFLLSIGVFFEVGLSECPTYIKIAPWIYSETMSIDWGFLFDSLTATMCVIVTFISFLVHLYSIEYMSHDPHLPRFMSYLSLFTFFMLILVTADNFVQMFIGWEGVGLCSYLLINFWFTRIQANKAAIKAMVLNRIGDFCLLIGIMLIFYYLKAVDYTTVTALSMFLTNKICFLNYSFSAASVIGVFLFLGAVGKSAQLGLHTWLPDAMEGPTPVSALIHAATMVTAGVFLLARASFIFERLDQVMVFIVVLGALTCFFAATTGLLQNDLKRVIAYSTCSQLGYMIFACGLSGYSVGVFHLSNHAFFKALLFLGAGSVIHSINDEQDMRKMGGLKNLLPFTYAVMVIGSLALAGFPFLSGFYSKDLILELALSKYDNFSAFAYILGTASAFLTAFYSSRLLFLTFLSKPNGYKKIILNAHDSSFYITFALSCLAIPSIFIGYFTKDMFVGVGSPFFNSVFFQKFEYFNLFDAEFTPYMFLKILPVCLSLLGILLATLLYSSKVEILISLKMSTVGRKFYQFLNKKWFFDKLYNEIFGQLFFSFGYNKSYKLIDKGVLEMLGPTGISITALRVSTDIRKLQTGSIYQYTFTILMSITALIALKQLLTVNYFLNIVLIPVFVISVFFILHDKD